MSRRFVVAVVGAWVAVFGGLTHAAGGGKGGPPGGPPPTEVGPPRLIGDYRPTSLKHQRYDDLVSGSKTASKSASKSASRSRPSVAEAAVAEASEGAECVVISSANMQEALQGCMSSRK